MCQTGLNFLSQTVRFWYGEFAVDPKISERIRRVTDDLRAIQQQLDAASRRDLTAAPQTELIDDLLNFELVKEFKSAVDNMRYILWGYIEAASHTGGDVDLAVQNVRMQRTTEMLRVLAERTDLSVPIPQARTFFEEVQEIAQSAIRKHYGDGSGDKSQSH